MPAASVILVLDPSACAAPLSAAFDTFWIVLAIIIGSGINEWLKKRKQAREPGSSPAESGAPPVTPRGTPPPPAPPRPVMSSDWEEELRRLLTGEPPPAKALPASPAPIKPVVIVAAEPLPPRTPASAAPAAVRTAPSPAESGMAEAERAVEVQLPGLRESATAYQRGGHLHEGVAEHLKQIDKMTQTQAGRIPVPLPYRRTHPPDVTQAILLIRHPATVRQAVIASMVFGPPKALEDG